MTRHLNVCLILAAFLFFGCSDPETPVTQPDAGQPDIEEVDPDVEVDTPGGEEDVTPDVVDDSCALHADCGAGRLCHDGECLDAPTCRNSNDWSECVEALNELDEDFGRRAHCHQGHCMVTCLMDQECAEGHLCSDNGMCIPSTAVVTGEHPGGGDRAPLQAGVSNVLMHFPIGLSMGGYGSRMSFNNGRYVESLRASHGQMHGVYARAVAIDNGEREMIMMRVPIILTSMAVHEAVARRLQEETGKDWRDSLIMSATHTHSGPTRYWNVPRDTTLPMGSMGSDEFSQNVFDWFVDTLTETALEARNDRKPSRMGWTIVEGFDTDDVIASDRWNQTPPFDDNRLLIIRVDDADGIPQGVIVSFGSHGTTNSSDYFTDDVILGIERKLEDALGETFGRFVPVLYFNQNGGSMSPRGGGVGHRGPQIYENIGELFVERTLEPLLDMEMSETWEINGHTHRFPITYELVGYEPGQWTHPVHGDYHYGGLSCIGDAGGDDWHTHANFEEESCLGVQFLAHHRPITILTRSQITALQLNDLTIITLPGEPAMEVGWQVLRGIRDAYGVDPMKSFTWGYAQDHLLYIVPTNLRGELPPFPGISTPMPPDDYPDFAFSYLQGGYEADMSPWGFLFGDYVVARAVEATGLMLGENVDVAVPSSLPKEFTRVEEAPFPIDLTDAARVGTVTLEPAEEVKRLDIVEFAWIGGDPGAEMPQAPRVVLEREEDGAFVEVMRPNYRPYDNREFTMITRLRKRDGEYEWVIYWEELKDFPEGHYRFRVEGHYQESEGTDGRKSYEATSRTFAFVPTDAIVVNEASLSSTTVSARFSYPAATEMGFTRTQGDPARLSGNYRRRHREVATGLADPLVLSDDFAVADAVVVRISRNDVVLASLTGADISVTTTAEPSGGREIPVTRVHAGFDALGSGAYTVEVEVMDSYGIEGHGTFELEIP
ncbi:MAG: neutral/alkaline non-lysosomal ceramidase N-terminal domain-containing protein [Bradymonadaceae bacterium]